MKALTIKQPWATLIALGEKKYETRSWRTNYRGKLAIHAGKQIDMGAFREPRIKSILEKHGITDPKQLPIGAVIAISELADCHQVIMDFDTHAETTGCFIDEYEYPLGCYEIGRFAWELKNVQPLETPIGAKGQLSLWEWNPQQ